MLTTPYLTLIIPVTAHGAISYGKLKIKVQTDHSILDGRSTVVATRDNSFLNKDGDIFKLHKPAILKDSLSDTISFESLRYPGHFLRASINKGAYNFRLEKPDDTYKDDDMFSKLLYIQCHHNHDKRPIVACTKDSAMSVTAPTCFQCSTLSTHQVTT